ncbi:MAG: hypothetical protein GEU80_06620 [Dehalococcoidia bacterium]|nr:hypothetical protein [Dehalococcoidia bacterium]
MSHPRAAWLTLLGALAFGMLLVMGCGDGDPPAEGAERILGLLGDQYPTYRDEETGLQAILGTPDLGVGRHRVAFVLQDEDGIVRLPVLPVRTWPVDDALGGATSVAEATARFHEFPLGTRGLYGLTADFDHAGDWALEVQVPRSDGSVAEMRFTFPIPEEPSAPDIGDPVPASEQRTAADVGSLEELTTSSEIDPQLYDTTVAEALEGGKPFVVVFASPAFCTNALCGPQVEVLSELREEYGDRARFVHIDLYENPHEIQGDLSRARRTPVLEEWGIHTDEWTFVVDAEGRVTARFEAFVTREELAAALERTLGASASH